MILPIDSSLKKIVSLLENENTLILEAAPGAGKTTRVPPAFLKATFIQNKKIFVIEPRRLAAKLAATRVAEELGEKIGKTVGYRFRFESQGTSETKIWFLTEGLFIRHLLSDPTLSDVGIVIIDEFHERHLHGDSALAILRALQAEIRKDLRVLIMSATLDSIALKETLKCEVVSVEGRAYPVETIYLDREHQYLDARVVSALRWIAQGENECEGDILVFLPGALEIRKCIDSAAEIAREHGWDLFPLYADLSRDDQERALKVSDRRRVIFSTNIAESSVTIPGIRIVIDTGLSRQASYSWWAGLPSLQTKSISRASAIQRAGRAGRTAPGKCIRLYSKNDFETRRPFDVPEIMRADLSQIILEHSQLKERISLPSFESLPWFEPPTQGSSESAQKLLYQLGALDQKGNLTETGRNLLKISAHPRVARIVLEGAGTKSIHSVVAAAVYLSEEKTKGLQNIVEALAEYEPRGLSKRYFDDLLSQSKKLGMEGLREMPPSSKGILEKFLLAGFPDRVGKLEGSKYFLSEGGTVSIPASHSEYVLVLDARESGARSQAQVSLYCDIQPEWLFDSEPTRISEEEIVSWDEKREKASVVSQIRYGELILTESTVDSRHCEAVARELVKRVGAIGWEKVFDAERVNQWMNRVHFLIRENSKNNVVIADNDIRKAIESACLENGFSSIAELKSIALTDYLAAHVDPSILGDLNRFAPESIVLARGRKVTIHYEADRPPWIESRLQDFFGMEQGPSINQGQTKLVLHLLAPNYRAVQVTTDLAGFWKRIYPDLRKELGRRYPRHSWPENPY